MEKLYHITTYGCQLNVHESEKLAGVLEDLGYRETKNQKDADVIIFNTCAIREGAENRAFGNIGAIKRLKAKNPNKIVAVCGCMSQQKENADYIYKTFPYVDIIFGTNNLHKFKDFLLNRLREGKRDLQHSEEFGLEGENVPMFRTSGENAWVNIMQGCNNFCSYCIVPYVRGRERSRPLQDILKEVEEIAHNPTYKTITLLGQNVNSYGKELGSNFVTLLQKVCEVEGDFKVTFMTSHPKDLSSEVIDFIAKSDKMLKQIHLPVQSGSNKILKLMNRNYTVEKYLSIINEIKEKIPNCFLSTDIIVGFPQETQEDFDATCELLKNVKYGKVFAFMYSKRRGTPASLMDGHELPPRKHFLTIVSRLQTESRQKTKSTNVKKS
ncbi:MAG: tRNA (N6-isopentenyl adenosine(37)-C2)-methylthiotransferase MiaB, partial [Clostridia bacterium]|nr:tRNA (N6-isopentenyl adenosine(37)-C2)-methylthiotransferase MiaB [Clostridia bacterium]